MELFPGHLLIGQIAAAVSCHADLTARFLILFENRDGCSVSGSHDSGSQSGSSAADNDHLWFFIHNDSLF